MASKDSKTSRATHNNSPASHSDFQLDWCQKLLNDPQNTIYTPAEWDSDAVNNQLFGKTLSTPDALKAHIFIRRPSNEPDAVSKIEDCYLMSVGAAVDGARGRAHGGFNSLILDHITGTCAHRESQSHEPPPATAYLNVQYKAPVKTPCVVLARAWMTEMSGRKVFLKGTLEDGKGHIYATATALYIVAREGAKI